jgi:predicted outer membrane protein
MKKLLVGSLLLVPYFVNAQSATGTTATTTPPRVDSNCASTAVEKRENALITAHDAFNTAVKTALTNRMTALKDAWSQTDKKVRQEKRQAGYKAFRTEIQAANSAMKTARNSAWKSFDTDMKACGVKGHGEIPQTINTQALTL